MWQLSLFVLYNYMCGMHVGQNSAKIVYIGHYSVELWKVHGHPGHLYILNAVRCPHVRTFVRHAGRGRLSSKWRHNENGAASAVGARCGNESDVLMIIAGLWRYGDWRHVVTGCNALVFLRSTVYSATANYNFWKSACRRSKRQNAERWPLTATFKVHTQTHEWYTTLQRRLIVTR